MPTTAHVRHLLVVERFGADHVFIVQGVGRPCVGASPRANRGSNGTMLDSAATTAAAILYYNIGHHISDLSDCNVALDDHITLDADSNGWRSPYTSAMELGPAAAWHNRLGLGIPNLVVGLIAPSLAVVARGALGAFDKTWLDNVATQLRFEVFGMAPFLRVGDVGARHIGKAANRLC